MNYPMKFRGNLKSGERVYSKKGAAPLVEKDHSFLVDATPAETAEIYEKWPYLKPANKEGI